MPRNKFVAYIISSTVLISCASTESYEQKMSRYTPRTLGKNKVPDFYPSEFKFAAIVKNSRSPASSAVASPTSLENVVNEEARLSNKKLYFLTLLGQYEGLKKYAQQFSAPDIKICPYFHSNLFEHNNRKTPNFYNQASEKENTPFSYEAHNFSNSEYVSARPELFLSLSRDEASPKVIDIFRSKGNKISNKEMDETVHKALDIHLAKTYGELRGLCEFGMSDNYYIYENLITHIKNNSFAPNSNNMNTLLKTTLFSNMALTSSLGKMHSAPSRSIASTTEPLKSPTEASYTHEVMTRLNLEWTNEYFNHLKSSH